MIVFDLLLFLSLILFYKKNVISFDKDNSAFLKAILPFFIISSHSHILQGFEHGTYYVGLFFFISGYGLENKRVTTNTMNWGGRFLKIFTPFLIPLILYIVTRVFTSGFSLNDVTYSLKHYELIVPYSWFILTIVQLYLMFLITTKISKKHFLLLISALITLYITVLYVCHVESTFYSSVYGFLAGILFYHVVTILKPFKKYSWLAVLLLAVSLAVYVVKPPMEMFYNLWIFSFSVAFILSAIVTKNRIISFLSDISYEVYLCQGIGFIIARMITDNLWMVFVITAIVSVVVGYISHILTKRLLIIFNIK